ncbi:MAG: hypothetical protein ACI4PO_08150 [Faecousia sp.]
MNIVVQTPQTPEENGHSIRLWLPNGFLAVLKWKWAWRFLPEEVSFLTPETAASLYDVLKAWRKENGPLTLVEVDTADGEHVRVTL